MLTPKVQQCSEELTAQAVGNALYGLRSLRNSAELRGLLRKLKLEAKLGVMRAWCDEEEVESLEDLARWVRKKEYGDALVAKLELKPGKAKASKLLELIAEHATQQPPKQQMSGRI